MKTKIIKLIKLIKNATNTKQNNGGNKCAITTRHGNNKPLTEEKSSKEVNYHHYDADPGGYASFNISIYNNSSMFSEGKILLVCLFEHLFISTQTLINKKTIYVYIYFSLECHSQSRFHCQGPFLIFLFDLFLQTSHY